jgi:PAS domain S-box-containing protein
MTGTMPSGNLFRSDFMRSLMLILGIWLSVTARAAEDIQVFVLHSYSQEYPWTKRQHEGFMQELQSDARIDFQTSVEYLDTKRVAYSPAYARQIADSLALKYHGYQPKFIYVSDDNALRFALNHLGSIFPDVPIFFSGINNYDIRNSLNPDQATGVFERKEIAPNLKLISQLAPLTREVILVGDESETASMIKHEIETALQGFPSIHASFVSSGHIDQLLERLAQHREHIVILTTLGAMKNRQGENISLGQTLAAISNTGHFSLFSMEDAYLYPGILGGFVTSGKQQGKAAAQLAKRYLAGTPLNQIAPITTSPNEYLFDVPSLQKAGLVLPDAVARQATLLNAPATFYETYRTAILLTLFALSFVSVMLLVTYLLALRNKNRQIALQTQALIKSEAQLMEAQEVARLGSWKLDLGTGEAVWSDQEYRLLGYEPGSVTASEENFMNAVHPDDRHAVTAEMMRALDHLGSSPFRVEHRVTTSAGERIVEEKARISFDENNCPVSMLGTTMDITERKQAEQAIQLLNEDLERRVTERTIQLAAARDEAERANQAKSEFLSSMSHELRTPMNAILGFSQLMEYGPPLPEEHKTNTREIIKAGNHLLELINEVLDLAKIESGQIDLLLEPVAIYPLVEDCLNLMHPLAEKQDIQLYQSGLKDVAVRADRIRLKQVLLNLLSNAVKYNRRGGSVKLEARLEGSGRLRILVSDTGMGIPAAQLPDLFQPFNRLNAEHSSIEGAGIGLTITRRIVEMMGGSVDVKSEINVGSTFWIELPNEPLPGPIQQELTSATSPATHHVNTDQHTVLYIEDNPSNLKLVSLILGRHKNIRLLTAHTPNLGIDLAQTHYPDLILLDINMPGMNGYQVLEIFKADARLKTVPVVAITANAMPRDIDRGKAAGFDDYVTKPLDVTRFLGLIDRLIGREK